MNLKDSLKKYFDEEIKKDSALAEKYDFQKIAECESYVMGEAKKYLHSQSGAIEDVIVFKWARDFFIDEVKNLESEKTEQKEQKAQIQEQKEVKTEQKQIVKSKKQQKEVTDYQLSFDFGE